jgi:hypothetical protein
MMTMTQMPDTLPADLRRLADAELSLPSRLGYVALLLAALTMTMVISALWLTEPQLPGRTTTAFAVMIAIGLSWTTFAVWVLTHKRILLAPHRIIAGRMAVAFSAVFALGALTVGFVYGLRGAFAAAGLGVLMTAVAVVGLVRAHQVFARLVERRETLARELGRSGR